MFLNTELFLCLHYSYFLHASFCRVSHFLIHQAQHFHWNTKLFIYESKHILHSLWSRSRKLSLTHAWPRLSSLYLGRLALDEYTALRYSPGAGEARRWHISWINSTVSEVTDAVVKSGPILENSLSLHKVFVFCLASMGRKIPPTLCYLWCNLVKLLRFSLMQTQLHNLTLIQM